ncbi:MAG TPA: hypothetical protein VK876_06030, partial [Rubrivivax sp.]|nr:hypothetical protein [Rubrivivax sp.]
MAEAAAPETPLLPRAKRSPAGTATAQAHRRLRLLIVLDYAVLALWLLANGWNMLRLHALLDADAELVEAAGVQGTQTQQIGRLAALVAADPDASPRHAMALRVALDKTAEDATVLDERLDRQLQPALGHG